MNLLKLEQTIPWALIFEEIFTAVNQIIVRILNGSMSDLRVVLVPGTSRHQKDLATLGMIYA